jgi:hypothetical protein
VVKNSLTLLKHLFIGGILSVGLMPGIAQAKWIKASVLGTQDSPGTQPVQLDFVLWNFYTGTANKWKQMGPAYGYAPLYGYGTGVSSTNVLQGPFLPQYTPGGAGNSFELNNDGTGLYMDLSSSATIPYLGKGFSGTQGAAVTSIQLTGTSQLRQSGPPNNPFSSSSTPNVVDFLSTAIANGGSSYSCSTPPCGTGIIGFTAESVFSFSWTSVQFDEIESVPTPLPIFGALSAFGFSRKLRKRINIQKIETLS